MQTASENAVSALSDAFTESAVTGSVAEWAAAVGALQRVVDVASAAQDAAIARLAAIETELLEDGTLVESHRALGYSALDAPAIVSGVLSVSAVWAERRVRSALRLAADGPAGTDTETGLGGLHEAMAAGRLDAYRASVIADELEEAPAEVRAAVVAALDEHLEAEDGTHLRRRCRRALEQISPDLLRQRARRARAESSLRRWAEEPGVDKWEGTFPSEEAAQAWAAIDALAQQYVADGMCSTIGRARAKALTDLVAGNATIETTLIVTVPAEAVPGSETKPEERAVPDPEAVPGSEAEPGPEPPAVPDPSPEAPAVRPEAPAAPDPPPEAPAVPDPVSRARTVPDRSPGSRTVPEPSPDAPAVSDPSPETPAVSDRSPEVPSVEDPAPEKRIAADPSTEARDVHDTGAGHEDLVEVTGPHRNQPVLVPRGWLTAMAGAGAVRLAGCHPTTGALLDLGLGPGPVGQRREPTGGDEVVARVAAAALAGAGADRYRPTARVAELVRTRDRRCRFPGCSVSARFCDLDHVRPWPHGRTTPDNLMSVCRRHHRVKQRPGWRVVLAPDGVTTWTDPTGRVRTSAPVDALHSLVVPGAATPEPDHGPNTSRTVLPDAPHSALEFRLEHLAETAPPRRPSPWPDGPSPWPDGPSPWRDRPSPWRDRPSPWRDDRGHDVEVTRAHGILVVEPSGHRPRRPGRMHRHRLPPETDPPPF
ncbi:hypothetical protein GCM10023168_24450 [Fodinibacter luteus]|uniref:HNH nuclease domain-containing protein n=1 Tax=Fodinibacter luteus TaxID=552064 RepID=A0ABP8KIZ5_9MICO